MEGAVHVHVAEVGEERTILIVVDELQELGGEPGRLLAAPGLVQSDSREEPLRDSPCDRAPDEILQDVDVEPDEPAPEMLGRDPGRVARESAGRVAASLEVLAEGGD